MVRARLLYPRIFAQRSRLSQFCECRSDCDRAVAIRAGIGRLQGGQATTMKAPVCHSKDPDLQKVPQALLRAAEKARQPAEQAATGFVVRPSPDNRKTK